MSYEEFVYWYNQYKEKKCTKKYARQMVGVKSTKWYHLCRDYENGQDVSKYFLHRVKCVETGEVFDTHIDAQQHLVNQGVSVPFGAVERCAKGRRKSVSGYHWRYV